MFFGRSMLQSMPDSVEPSLPTVNVFPGRVAELEPENRAMTRIVIRNIVFNKEEEEEEKEAIWKKMSDE
jgi:ribosomal protein S6